MPDLPKEFQKIRDMLGELNSKSLSPEARRSVERMKKSFDRNENKAQLLTNALDLIKALDDSEAKVGNESEEASGGDAGGTVADFDSRRNRAASDPTTAVQEFVMAMCVIMSVSDAPRRRYIVDLLKSHSSTEKLRQLEEHGMSSDDKLHRQLSLLDGKLQEIAQVIEQTWKDMDDMTAQE